MKWNGHVWEGPNSFAFWSYPPTEDPARLTICSKGPKGGSHDIGVVLSAEDLRTAARAFLEAAEEMEALKKKKEEATKP
jgi:hypothetical protein